MDRKKLIKEILKALIDKNVFMDCSVVNDFLFEIKDSTVLGDILADLKGE